MKGATMKLTIEYAETKLGTLFRIAAVVHKL